MLDTLDKDSLIKVLQAMGTIIEKKRNMADSRR